MTKGEENKEKNEMPGSRKKIISLRERMKKLAANEKAKKFSSEAAQEKQQ